MAHDLSVILCTHNPRTEPLARTLASLKNQALPPDRWELLVIDNASSPPLSGRIDLSWHSAARVIREDALGLTAARLRGIRESAAPILGFVDDDNVLDALYLTSALELATCHPHIGCWGGEIIAEFASEPPAWLAAYHGMLAIRPLARDRWGNAYQCDDAMPCGAGMCVRRSIAERYSHNCQSSPLRHAFDRRGSGLSSNGDIDLAYTAIDMGLGTGRFQSMRLTHLIPTARMQPDYLVALAEAMAQSNILLEVCRPQTAPRLPRRIPLTERIAVAHQWLKATPLERRILLATRRGLAKAYRELEAGVSEAGVSEAGVSEAGVSEAGVSEAGVSEAGVSERAKGSDASH